MKKILVIAAMLMGSSASASSCVNTAHNVNGEWVYTASVCEGQAPASQHQLDMMTEAANDNRDHAASTEEVVVQVPEVAAAVATVAVAPSVVKTPAPTVTITLPSKPRTWRPYTPRKPRGWGKYY